MCFEPAIVFLVGAIVIENDVNLAVGGYIADNLIHESLDVGAFLRGRGLGADLSGGDVQGGEHIERAVAPGSAFKSAHDLPAGGLHAAAGPRQCLNTGLLVDAQHQGVFRRGQIEANDIGSLGGKLRVRTCRATNVR